MVRLRSKTCPPAGRQSARGGDGTKPGYTVMLGWQQPPLPPVSAAAGECGVKDQVSRTRPCRWGFALPAGAPTPASSGAWGPLPHARPCRWGFALPAGAPPRRLRGQRRCPGSRKRQEHAYRHGPPYGHRRWPQSRRGPASSGAWGPLPHARPCRWGFALPAGAAVNRFARTAPFGPVSPPAELPSSRAERPYLPGVTGPMAGGGSRMVENRTAGQSGATPGDG